MTNNTIKIIKVFNTGIENVFEAWTNSEQIGEWLGPRGMVTDVSEMDANEGGIYRMAMKSLDGNIHRLRGVFKSIDRPNKIVLSWQWEQVDSSGKVPLETLVTATFRPLDEDRTEMTLLHEGFPNAGEMKAHEAGWRDAVKKLEEIFP